MVQYGQVTRLGGGVTTDVHQPRRFECQQHLHHLRVHARPRRVGDQHVRLSVPGRELLGQDRPHVPGVEGGVAHSVQLGVDPRVVDGRGNLLNTHHLPAALGQVQGNGTDTGIEVVYVFLPRQPGEVAGDGVELFGLGGVGLEERLRPDPKLHVPQPFGDVVRTGVVQHLQVHQVLVDLRVDAVEEARNFFPKAFHCRIQEAGDRLPLVAEEGHHQHALSGRRGTHHQLPQ